MVVFGLSLDTSDIKIRLGLTERQYYSRMSRLIRRAGNEKKRGLLTSLGKVVYVSHTLIGQAIEDCRRLKAIDSIAHQDAYAEEYKRIIDTLIDNNNIKSVLLKHASGQNDKLWKKQIISNLRATIV